MAPKKSKSKAKSKLAKIPINAPVWISGERVEEQVEKFQAVLQEEQWKGGEHCYSPFPLSVTQNTNMVMFCPRYFHSKLASLKARDTSMIYTLGMRPCGEAMISMMIRPDPNHFEIFIEPCEYCWICTGFDVDSKVEFGLGPVI
ncbi:unnamed protein product [Prunus brigantina]